MRLPTSIVLYTKPGCHLCDEARVLLQQVFAERAAAGKSTLPVEERDILTNEAWERAHATTIPVIELGTRSVPLATSAARIRRLLAEELDNVVTA